ncbi:MAG: hypothetical protein R3D43_02245 [Tepidamorphaceae bacterium]|nr:hypothetical protein [Rhodobiaceae bacterium]MCC0049589.1 hypothetical protein [Rhodobiaceae bacterium]
MSNAAHSNPMCKCNPCTCKPICTCGLDADKPVSVEGSWDENAKVMTYVVKLKAKA